MPDRSDRLKGKDYTSTHGPCAPCTDHHFAGSALLQEMQLAEGCEAVSVKLEPAPGSRRQSKGKKAQSAASVAQKKYMERQKAGLLKFFSTLEHLAQPDFNPLVKQRNQLL